MPHNILLIRCRESVDPDIFRMVESQLRELAGETVRCETLNLISLNYRRESYLKKIFDRDRVRFAKEILRAKKPDVLVSGNDVAISATFIKVCNLLKVPSVVIQHGVPDERRPVIFDFLRWRRHILWRIVSLMANLHSISRLTLYMGWRTRVLDWGSGGATKYVVMGDYSKRFLISEGVQRHKIVVTGYPLFDLVHEQIAALDRQAILEKLGLKGDRKVILYTSQCRVEDGVWHPRLRKILARTIIDSARRLGAQLVIKVHPREEAGDYERLSKSYEGVRVVEHFNLHELLLASDVVVNVNSSAGLWALAYGKPLISAICFPATDYNVCKGASFEVNKLEDMPRALELVLENQDFKSTPSEETEQFLRDRVYKLDGCASRRIARLIISLAQKSTNRDGLRMKEWILTSDSQQSNPAANLTIGSDMTEETGSTHEEAAGR